MDIAAKKPSLNLGTIKRMTDLKKTATTVRHAESHTKHTLSVQKQNTQQDYIQTITEEPNDEKEKLQPVN